MAFDWSQLPLANTPWRIQVVADILSILIRRAQEGRPIFYGELADQLKSEFGHEPKARKTVYGPAICAVGQAIELTQSAVLVCPRAPSKKTNALIKRLNVNFHRVPAEAEK
ncbi:hypothetical protein VDF13_18250 [Xanthomonas campestris pv. raphani]|uniref:hypothetical protein n=1 Tax=Xanthomonas campestris TaxID=339 RepID=UPI001E2B898F|nr:hypothetical protein [Xanthomonas campestris]MCC8485788.1 hypothetical protein [Xanthomonas campestris]MEA9652041.1 hypothetical protein [Xanthomonas campestris pv. raphani]MEA9745192.1 hypothetical protein [Xanthomonas campestris pv. raphani]MEA9769230.1 hypothetical protein [Xanthomonas campestris pv. raphani]MEA9870319.1 hypothetical protein [Xanthomonas campestris pv. raphani]